jgi:hypothetical protein
MEEFVDVFHRTVTLLKAVTEADCREQRRVPESKGVRSMVADAETAARHS